jgi:hypothetical protein
MSNFQNPRIPPTGGSHLPHAHPSSFEMRRTVPVPMPSDLAIFKIPIPFASSLRTLRSVVLSTFGHGSHETEHVQWSRTRMFVARDGSLQRVERAWAYPTPLPLPVR